MKLAPNTRAVTAFPANGFDLSARFPSLSSQPEALRMPQAAGAEVTFAAGLPAFRVPEALSAYRRAVTVQPSTAITKGTIPGHDGWLYVEIDGKVKAAHVEELKPKR